MLKRWENTGASTLIVVFCGWGTDPSVFRHLAVKDCDLLFCYSYHLEDEWNLADILARYPQRYLLAWSLGVYAAWRTLPPVTWQDAVAINGTLEPISEQYGIAPAVFAGTLAGWSEAAQTKFNRRMCGDAETWNFFQKCKPARSALDQKQELQYIASWIKKSMERKIFSSTQLEADSPMPPSPFVRAVVGLRDRIFVPANQQRAWARESRVSVTTVDLPHYLFGSLRDYAEIRNLGKA